MPQCMRRDSLVDPRHLSGGVKGAIEWRVVIGSGGSRPGNSQPAAAPPYQARSKANSSGESIKVTILAALALLDAHHHALGVDVGDLQRDHFGGPQSGAIGRRSTPPCTSAPVPHRAAAPFLPG